MNCYISSSCSTKKMLEDVLHELTGLGFRSIELTGNISYQDDLEELILHSRERYNLDLIVHNYLPIYKDELVLNLSSGNPETRRQTQEIVDRAIALSKRLGKTMYSVHPGFRHELLPRMEDGFFIKVIQTEDCNSRGNFFDAVRQIAAKHTGNGFRIALENLSPKNSDEIYSFMCLPDDIFDFLAEFNNAREIGMLLDLGHLNVSANILGFDKHEFLERLMSSYESKLFEIHISENCGTRDEHAVCPMESWQLHWLETVKHRLPDIPVVFEWQRAASPATYAQFRDIQQRLTYGSSRN